MSVISNDDLVRLFSYFARYPDTTSQRQDELMHIQSKCNELFAKDYNLSIISNRQGELCATYPLDLVILESEKDPASASGTVKYVKRTKIFSSLGSSDEGEDKSSSSSLLEGIGSSGGEYVPSPIMASPSFSNNPSASMSEGEEGSRSVLTGSTGVNGNGNEDEKVKNDGIKLEPMFQRCRFARVRTRFPVPVILWNGKNICRSSTLSQKLEYMLQAAHNTLVRSSDVPPDMMTRSHMESLRNRDIVTIKQLGVKYILDLMMENKKKKFGFTVCSSEKVDMHERYATFTIASIPYPGVEFFQEFNQRKHVAHDLHFDWGKYEDVVELKLDDPIPASNIISWRDYKTWDLVLLTKNYLRLMLYQLSDPAPDAGLLVHCISGWDRTPLFISLLRITMWADKQIHQSLHVEELLYLTVAYDWLLFSHQLYDRASRGEDIFYFCFYFLQFIHSPEFSIPVDLTAPAPSFSPTSPPTPTPPPSAPSILPTSPTPIPASPLLTAAKEPIFSEQERKEAADSDSDPSFSNAVKKTPSLERFSSLSAKLNGSSNSLPNPRRTPPQEPRLSALSSSFTTPAPTPSIPISKKGEPETNAGSLLPSSPSPSAISTSFSMISSTPHSYKTSTFVPASASGTRPPSLSPSPSPSPSPSSSSSSSSATHSHSFIRSNGTGVSIPHSHSHSGHSHSHSHSHSRHSYRETPPMEISHHRGNGASRKVSDSCDPVDCTCGSWQMVSEFSFSDKSHPHPHLLQTQTPPSTATEDSDDDSTDSSSHFDPVDADFTGSSWENDGVFPQDMELGRPALPSASHPRHPLSTPSSSSSSSASTRMYRSGSSSRLPPLHPLAAALPPSSDVKVPAQLPNEALRSPPMKSLDPDSNSNFGGKTDARANGKVALTDAEEPKPEPGTRAARLSELQHMGMRLYDQCCRAQAGQWTFLTRFLPRFV